MHVAVYKGNLDIIKLLMDAGADPKIADKDGTTALSLAEEQGNAEIVEYLKSKM